jgi:hypothetical protein
LGEINIFNLVVAAKFSSMVAAKGDSRAAISSFGFTPTIRNISLYFHINPKEIPKIKEEEATRT